MLHDLKTNVQRFQYATSIESQRRRKRLHAERRDFTIVSNDCWGAEVYKDLGLPFSTPFIGVFLEGPCYMKLARDFRRIVESPLRFTETSKYSRIAALQALRTYPIGLLDDDVEIHFLHFTSPEDAAAKWQRRVGRINFDRLHFKLSADSEMVFSNADLYEFDALPLLHKLILTRRLLPEVRSAVTIEHYVSDGKLMYDLSLKHFDIVAWLNGSSRQDPARE